MSISGPIVGAAHAIYGICYPKILYSNFLPKILSITSEKFCEFIRDMFVRSVCRALSTKQFVFSIQPLCSRF